MIRTIRRLFSQEPCCAQGALRRAMVPALHGAIILATCLFLASRATPAVADDLAYSDLFLNAGSGTVQGAFLGFYNQNEELGATRFYNAGFTGTNAVIANVEAGYTWNGHETLTHVGLIPVSNGAAGEYDRHATWVGMVMAGRPTDPANDYQRGMAPDAQLFSGAIATSWPVSSSYPRYTAAFYVDFNAISTYGPYRAAFISGVTGAGGTRTADVINSSFVGAGGFNGITGTDTLSGTLDALISENPRTLLTIAAGNTLPSGEGPNHVASPASGFNGLSVAALGPNSTDGAIDTPSYFSNGGPNDYWDPSLGSAISQVRQVVDIAAPGQAFSTAYYGGETGGNGASLYGPPGGTTTNCPACEADWYSRSVSGTSFSAPTVAGGAALLYDAAYAVFGSNPDARDARVMKAVLMNSADKTADWNNGQTDHPNGNGGVFTTQGLDNRVGTGRMNLARAFTQFLWGTTDVAGSDPGPLGTVAKRGWDLGYVSEGATNDYLINGTLAAGTTFTATLDWFRDRRTSSPTGGYYDDSYDNLDLEMWSTISGVADKLISESSSTYNNVEHFQFLVPQTGQYMLRVRWKGELFDLVGAANSEMYGLAWANSVPEPTAVCLLAIAIPALLSSRRRTL